MIREVIRPLKAWDTDQCCSFTLEPGAVVCCCRIEPNATANPEAGVEPYIMEFSFSGRRSVCPLFTFQARTQTLELIWVEGIPALEAIAV